MTCRIFKYQLKVTDKQTIAMPTNAQILSVQVQHETPCIWALVEDNPKEIEDRTFRMLGTGHPILEPIDTIHFIGTFQMNEGIYIFHLFEQK